MTCHSSFGASRFGQSGDILVAIIKQMFGTLVTPVAKLLNSPCAGIEQEIRVILHVMLKSYERSIVPNLLRHQQRGESVEVSADRSCKGHD